MSFRGPSAAWEPGTHEHGPLEYGFRARRCAAPRNDSVGRRPPEELLTLRLGRLPQRDLFEQGLNRAAGKAERGLVDEAAVFDLRLAGGDDDLARQGDARQTRVERDPHV